MARRCAGGVRQSHRPRRAHSRERHERRAHAAQGEHRIGQPPTPRAPRHQHELHLPSAPTPGGRCPSSSMPCTATSTRRVRIPTGRPGQAHAFCQALQHRLILPSAWLRRRAMGDHRHQHASRASPTLDGDSPPAGPYPRGWPVAPSCAGLVARCARTGRRRRPSEPSPFPSAGRRAYTAGTPSPSTCTAAGSPVSAPPRRRLGSRCAVRLQRH